MSVDAAASDRLPWLADEVPLSAVPRRRRGLGPWALCAFLVAATFGSWMGVRSVDQANGPIAEHPQHSLTLPLPPARAPLQPEVRMPAQQDVRPLSVPQVRPTPLPDVRLTTPVRAKLANHVGPKSALAGRPMSSLAGARTIAETSAAETAVPLATPAPALVLRPWNPRITVGAGGRLVQIGAFGSVLQAKQGWWSMVRSYPAMAHLPAVVRPAQNSKGRAFYRFQVGTTSQAHSEVLCQRMLKIDLSCAVIGLPWKAKVER